jgi:membrane protease YdiL (CAAX protease family)
VIVRRDPRTLFLAVVIAVLIAATAFGLWHLLVGGVVNGNPRAGRFGVALAVVAGAILSGVVLTLRRRRR